MFFDYVKNKKVSVHYESGFAFDIVYPEKDVLQWIPTSDKSLAPSGREHYEVEEVSDKIFYVNWVEETGVVVSQILNFNSNKVLAFMTWNDEKGRGGRASIFQKGSFEVK